MPSKLILPIPCTAFQFGQRVRCTWHEAGCPPTDATITGVNYDHRRDREPTYTITEDEGQQTDGIDSSMLSPLG